MEVSYVSESSWRGEFILTRRCSKCGCLVDDKKARFCGRCGHQFISRPMRVVGSKLATMVEAYYASKEGE